MQAVGTPAVILGWLRRQRMPIPGHRQHDEKRYEVEKEGQGGA
jgi:hypothetical protein